MRTDKDDQQVLLCRQIDRMKTGLPSISVNLNDGREVPSSSIVDGVIAILIFYNVNASESDS